MLLADLCSDCDGNVDVGVDDDNGVGGCSPGSAPGTGASVPEGMDEGPGIGSSEDGRMTKSAAAAIHARFDFLLFPAVPAKLGIAAAAVVAVRAAAVLRLGPVVERARVLRVGPAVLRLRRAGQPLRRAAVGSAVRRWAAVRGPPVRGPAVRRAVRQPGTAVPACRRREPVERERRSRRCRHGRGVRQPRPTAHPALRLGGPVPAAGHRPGARAHHHGLRALAAGC